MEGKRGKNIPLTQEIGTSCATAQCNHLSHLDISSPITLPFTSANKWWSHVHFVSWPTITDLDGQVESRMKKTKDRCSEGQFY